MVFLRLRLRLLSKPTFLSHKYSTPVTGWPRLHCRGVRLPVSAPGLSSRLSTGFRSLAGVLDPAAEALYDDASGDLAIGDIAAAVAKYREATELDPKYFDAWHALGMARLAAGGLLFRRIEIEGARYVLDALSDRVPRESYAREDFSWLAPVVSVSSQLGE